MCCPDDLWAEMADLLLIAASGLAREVVATIGNSRRVLGILDDDAMLAGASIGGVSVLGPVSSAADHPSACFLVCVGNGSIRRQIVERLRRLGVGPGRYATIVDSSVRVPAGCQIGAGSILLAHAVLTTSVSVGRHVVVMPNATLTHDDVVEDFVTICAGVTLGGTVRIQEAAYLGMNAAIRENVVVGAGSTVGMGSVVLEDVRPGATVVGVPARPMFRTTGIQL